MHAQFCIADPEHGSTLRQSLPGMHPGLGLQLGLKKADQLPRSMAMADG